MKSQSELNWVFILITGTVILIFFVSFAFKYKSLQEEKLSLEILNNLDNTLTSLKSSPYNTFDKINLPIEIQVTCNEIKLNNNNFKTNNLLFSKETLKNKMLIYYKPFKAPFKISDFYLITDVNTRYNLVYDESTKEYVKELIDDLPQDLKQKFTLSFKTPLLRHLENNNFKNVEVKELKDNKIKINNFQIPLNKDLAYAAIFSDNFECNFNKIKQEINKAVNVYQDKVNVVRQENCNYYSFISYLDQLRNLDFNAVINIETLNQDLAKKSCPTLY